MDYFELKKLFKIKKKTNTIAYRFQIARQQHCIVFPSLDSRGGTFKLGGITVN